MKDRYIVFDVETPNYANDRMSAIGVTVVENGAIVEELYSLVDPEVHFDGFNIRLTGITPELVNGAPTFPELWERIGPVMGSGTLVAHSAPFDLGVLAKCLDAYGIDWQPCAYYACTCVMGRECYPELENHKLNTLCSFLSIELDHHNAGSDSHACAELLLNYQRRGLKVEEYIRRYSFATRRSDKAAPKPSPDGASERASTADTGGIDIAGKIFCLTGEFACGERPSVESALLKRGGIPVCNVSRKTDYLIVGSKGSAAWSGGSYGAKIKKALELREKGIAVRIIREQDIADYI